MRFEILQTGSDGNCTVVEDQIAIDMGVTQKIIEPYIDKLRLVLLTHQHGDHFRPSTVRALARARPALFWACCEWMVPHLLAAGVPARNINIHGLGVWMNYRPQIDVMVCPIPTHHNVPNCAWKLWRSSKDNLFYATDLGDMDGIEAKGYQTYLLEANHTKAEIEADVRAAQERGEYSYRIKAAENHLSEEQAIEWLLQNQGPDSVWIPMHQHKDTKGRETEDG